MRRRKDLEEYTRVEQKTEAGGSKTVWTYRGSYYCMPLSGRRLRLLKSGLLLLAAVQAVLLFLAGYGNPDGLRRLYVVMPFLIVLFFVGRNLLQAITFLVTPDRMTRRQSENTVIGMALSAKVMFFCAAVLALTQVIFMILSGDSDAPESITLIATLALMLASALEGWLLRRHRCHTEE